MTARTRIRTAGWVATAAIAVGLALPAATFASGQVAITDTSMTVDCTGGPGGSNITPGAGQVAWLFVHANVSKSASGTLTAVYTTAGTKHASSYIQGGVKYLVVTDGSDTLTAFSDTISGGQLVLSHVCYGAQGNQPVSSPVSSPSSSPTDSPTNSPTSSQTTGGDQPTGSQTTGGDQPTGSQTTGGDQPTGSQTTGGDQPTGSQTTGGGQPAGSTPSNDTLTTTSPSSDPSSAPTTDPSKAPTPTPFSQVLGITGTPQVTLPPTDVVSAQGGNGGTGWQLVLLAVAGIATTLFVLTPATARKRR